MKKLLCVIILLISIMLFSSAVAAEKEIVTHDGLVLLSPQSFFDEKYTFFNAIDNTPNGSTWVTYSFRLVGDATLEEVEADAESYYQALADSRFFVRADEKAKYNLSYTGDQTVAAATSSGKDQGWHININVSSAVDFLDIPHTIQINLTKAFSFSDTENPYKEETESAPNNSSSISQPTPDDAQKNQSKITAGKTGEIAWDDGRTIADPGDFLGYEIELLETSPGTNDFGGFTKYVYEAIPMADIVKLVDAIASSPYFTYSGGSGGVGDQAFWLARHNYIGPDAELAALCQTGRNEQYGRKSDLSIYVFNPNQSESRFALYQYPGFTINTDTSNIKKNNDVSSDGKERCIYCDYGRCKTCGGSGQVYQWVPGESYQRRVTCTGGCMNGSCTVCDGDGWR